MKQSIWICFLIAGLLVLAEAASAEIVETIWLKQPDKTSRVVKTGWIYESGSFFYEAYGRFANYVLQEQVTAKSKKAARKANFNLILTYLDSVSYPNDKRIMTIQGTHDFETGRYDGTVVATSSTLDHARGDSVTGEDQSGIWRHAFDLVFIPN